MSDPRAGGSLALEHLELMVGGRQVRASLARFPASERGPRRPRWMLRIDGGEPLRGPLTWNGTLDPETERAAIADYLRDRRRVAREYREAHGELLRHMSDLGTLGVLANALGVAPDDLLTGVADEPE